MKQFMAVFTGTPARMEAWRTLDDATRRDRENAGKKAWGHWVAAHQKSIVNHGSPLGKTKKVDANGLSDIRNALAAWAIVQAESQEEAAKLFLGHPHFTIFPGDAVEVMECLPIPT